MSPLPCNHYIVGSGAVAAVIAQHLERAGHPARFIVRDIHSPNCQMPRSLFKYALRHWTQETQNIALATTLETQEPVMLWLTTPSNALASPWLTQLLSSLPAHSRVITLQPDLDDKARVQQHTTAPCIQGMIGFISFQSPLPGETTPGEGMAYLLPPGALVFEKTADGRKLAALMSSCGIPSRTSANLGWLAGRLSSVMIPSIAALECANWSFKALWKSDAGKILPDACREAIAATAAHQHASSGALYRWLPVSWLLKGLMPVSQRVIPFDIEVYLQYHFSKVRPQTRQMLASWQQAGRLSGRTTPALDRLIDMFDAQVKP